MKEEPAVSAGTDAGNYLILLELKKSCSIEAGSLGNLLMEQGWYVYSGSARRNLSARIARHQRKEKKKHWHIDYLAPCAETIKALPIITLRNIECNLAADLEALGGRGISGFGCSDCRCKSHLFYFPDFPLENSDFQNMLFRYRHERFN